MELTPENQIEMFLHCGKCLDELPDNITPRDWSMVQVGWTKQGIQIWCNRHNCNVMHMDLERQKHPANVDSGID